MVTSNINARRLNWLRRNMRLILSIHRPVVQILKTPKNSRHVRGHRWRHPERVVQPTEVIVGDVHGDSNPLSFQTASIIRLQPPRNNSRRLSSVLGHQRAGQISSNARSLQQAQRILPARSVSEFDTVTIVLPRRSIHTCCPAKAARRQRGRQFRPRCDRARDSLECSPTSGCGRPCQRGRRCRRSRDARCAGFAARDS
jgi:hypothetical protein